MLAYLACYNHRVAISNKRLIAADAKGVTFTVKDYRIEGPGRYKACHAGICPPLPDARAAQRLSPHSPRRLLATGNPAEAIAKARELLKAPVAAPPPQDTPPAEEAFQTRTAMPLLWRTHEGC